MTSGTDVPVSGSFSKRSDGVSNSIVLEFGVDDAAFLISALKSFLGEVLRIEIFFAGGVLLGVVGRTGWGVSCFNGVVGFLIGVVWRELAFGVTEAREALLRRVLRNWALSTPGLPVSDALNF